MSKEPEEEFKDLIAELRRGAPEAPPVHWGAYRAELRAKLEQRVAQPWSGWSWRLRPVQVAVAAGFVAVLVYIGLPGYSPLPSDPALVDNVVLASRLDMIGQLEVVQNLDLLEDFDVIRRLDALSPSGEG